MTWVYLLLWSSCAVGPADYVLTLPSWSACHALEAALAGKNYPKRECRSPEWASIEAAGEDCPWMGT